MRNLLILFMFLATFQLSAQDIQVEYNKERDLTKYKTFSLGEGEIITPKDRRTAGDEKMHKWIRDAVSSELKDKGLEQLDSLGDLVVTYVIGSLSRSDLQNLGPMGETPGAGASSQIWSRDYQQSSLIIDLNDKENALVWRINAVTNTSSQNAYTIIEEVVAKGFKKFSIKTKKKKK